MKFQTRFLQLPVTFDAGLLASEIASLDDSAWRPHPSGYAGNDFVPLIAAFGDSNNESFQGPMRPTQHLSTDRPYLQEVLGSLGAVLGRTRLMRLSGQAEVAEHVDVNYYWRDRMRVHVPIITQPTVKFYCGDAVVHMAAGECWVFDTWSLHRVVNDQTDARIHLVADTVGGSGFLQLLSAARAADLRDTPNWRARHQGPTGAKTPLDFENVNVPIIMSPWELREHLSFLLSECAPNQPRIQGVTRLTGAFLHRWRAVWSAYGEAEPGWPHFRMLLNQFAADLRASGAQDLMLVNGVDFFSSFSGLVLGVAVTGSSRGPLLTGTP